MRFRSEHSVFARCFACDEFFQSVFRAIICTANLVSCGCLSEVLYAETVTTATGLSHLPHLSTISFWPPYTFSFTKRTFAYAVYLHPLKALSKPQLRISFPFSYL